MSVRVPAKTAQNPTTRTKSEFLAALGKKPAGYIISPGLYCKEISHRTRWWCLKCVKVYPPRDIRPFVMYCVNGKPRSSLLIESTDSMILILILLLILILQWTYRDSVLSSDARLHVHPIHFLARRAVC